MRATAARALEALAAPFLLTVGVLAPFVAVVSSGRTLSWGVSANLFGPTRPLVVEALRDFRLPLWNPYSGTGAPLLAETLHGVLHPASLFAALLAPDAGLDLVMLLHLASAALGAYALARVLGVSRAGAVASGFAYGLGGFTVSMTYNLPFLAGAASVPWSLAGMRIAGAGHRLGVAAAAAGVLVCAVSGDFQALAVAGVLGAALAAEGGGSRGLLRAAGAAMAGLLMAGIQLWPSWIHLGRSIRSLPLSMVERTDWAFAVPRMIEWVVPGFFWGMEKTSNAPVFAAFGGSQVPLPFAASVFIGAPVLLLAGAGVRASRTARLLGVSALVLLWVAFGRRFGAEQLLHAIPVWQHFRYMEKLAGPFSLCVAVLAGFGCDRVWTGPEPAGLRATALVALAAALAIIAVVTLAPALAEAGLRWAGAATPAVDAAPLARARLAQGLVHTAAALTAAVALITWSRLGARIRLARAGLSALFFAQSAAALPYAWHLGATPHALRPSLAGEAPGPRVDVPFLPSAPPRIEGMDDCDAEQFVLARMLMPAHNVAARIESFRLYSGFPPLRYEALAAVHGEVLAALERRLGTTHFIIPAVLDGGSRFAASAFTAGGTLVSTDAVLGSTVWSVPHRPWASFAPAAEAEPDENAALAAVITLTSAHDPTVVVEGTKTPSVSTGHVLEVARGAEWSRVEAEAQGDALLVVNDAYWPGWTATIDGRRVEILAADALVRAVPWPRGRHLLRMRYEPPEIVVGWGISALGVLLLTALLLATSRRAHVTD